jgi:3-oxoacyl-[acyl-carrier protein] reductase
MKNKVMIITGTRKGIGNNLAKSYLEKGFMVAGCDVGKSTIEHKNYTHHELDVSDEKKVSTMVKDTKRKYKKIDILINNAGIASMNHLMLTPTSTVHKIFNTNFLGTFLFTREVSKVMILKKQGRIINISSIAVPLALEGESVYAASKSAIENFTKVAARELGEYNITVNCVGIAPLMTDLLKFVPQEKIDNILDKMMIKRLAEYRDVINVIDFFINDQSDHVTGQVIYLGGVS